jgi:hypothetical protein
MNIRQLNASYVREEDRVLLRLVTHRSEEYRLWLTRTVMGSMMQLVANLSFRSVQHEKVVLQAWAMVAFNQKQPQSSSFKGSANLPLGAEPVLVKWAQVIAATDQHVAGAQPPELLLQLGQSKSLKLRVTDDLTGKLQVLMQQMNELAGWHLQAMTLETTGQLVSSKPDNLPLDEEKAQPRKVLH